MKLFSDYVFISLKHLLHARRCVDTLLGGLGTSRMRISVGLLLGTPIMATSSQEYKPGSPAHQNRSLWHLVIGARSFPNSAYSLLQLDASLSSNGRGNGEFLHRLNYSCPSNYRSGIQSLSLDTASAQIKIFDRGPNRKCRYKMGDLIYPDEGLGQQGGLLHFLHLIYS